MTRTELLFSHFTRIRPGEGRGIILLGCSGFLLVCSYYILKTLRETLILTEFNAETKAYAVAAIAVVLFFAVPLYGVLFRNTNRTQLVVVLNLFFVVNLIIFFLMNRAGLSIAFHYYVWIGIFGVMAVTQFWAYATDIYNVRSGQRVFPLIMIATSIGGLAGAQFSAVAFPVLGTQGLMLTAAAMITLSMFFYRPARHAAPEDSRSIECEFIKPKFESLFGGFAVVFSDRYLRLIALFVVLLNWINSTGEYILSEMVVRWADAQVASGAGGADKEALIAWFYGNFSFWVTLVALLIQTFVVARVLRYLGVSRSLMILPLISAIGYAVIVFVPIFSIVRLVKISENAVDYSLTTTLRQTLFLPTSREQKYEGKTAIDTFFWRFGDLIQGGAIYVGLHVYQFGVAEFAMANLVLAAVWTVAAAMIAREYPRVVAANMTSRPPMLNRPIPDHIAPLGTPLNLVLDAETFVDPDPGDVVILRASLTNGEPLPSWLRFNSRARQFFGHPPDTVDSVTVQVVASDLEHLTATDSFTIRFTSQPA